MVLYSLALVLSAAVAGVSLASPAQTLARPLEVRHSRTLPVSVIAKSPVDSSTGYPVVDGKKWDSKGPWYQPVAVRDSASTYVAVLDKQKQGSLKLPELTTVDSLGVFSNWSRDGIRLVGNGQFQACFFVLCGTNYPRIAVEGMEVKLGDQVFVPQRSGDKFLVDEPLAQALKTATPGTKALLRVKLASGVTITQAINDKTVQAWPKVFQDAIPTASGGPVGGGTLSTAKTVAIASLPTPPPDLTSKWVATDSKTGLPLVNGSTWRTGRNVAWSTPVIVRDEFDGEYKAVLSKRGGFMSQWSRNFVDVFLSSRFITALTFSGIPSVHITFGDRTLNLYGQHNRFPINKMAAQFLQEAGEKTLTKLPTISYYVGKNRQNTYDLDIGTVKAWASLYREDI
ncbi:hypothetical protein [Altericista sp. CCNU0014]|uniref:hypothetical protein n=1 Tax=Altericista sp. CCNU0014 TaxID=3082949 RepID=UPI00384EE7B5